MPKPQYLALLSLAAAAHAASIPPNTVELSGTALFQHLESEGSDASLFGLAPAVYYYPSSGIFLGPILQIASQWSSQSSVSQQEIGAEFGGIFSPGNGPLHIFAGAGASVVRIATSYDYLDVSVENSEGGYGLDVFAGLKFRLGANFCLNVQPTYDFTSVDGGELNNFNVRLGFSGFLFPRAAASQP